MTTRREVRRMEKAMASIPDPGCPACRHRRGLVEFIEDDTTPVPPRCEACGKIPEFLVWFHDAEERREEEP